MTAGRYSIRIEQGATYERTFTWNDEAGAPVNLTGYTARMKIKTTKTGTEIDSFTNGAGLTLGGVAGTIVLAIPAADTAAYNFARAVYDMELVSGAGIVTRLLEGEVFLSLEVTT